MNNANNNYTHYVKCRSCNEVVALWELETVDQWPTGYHGTKDEGFAHGCGEGQKGYGTSAPITIPGGPLSREEALKLIPFGKLSWK